MPDGRAIAAKAECVDLEVEQPQPVAQAPWRDEFTHIGQIQLAARAAPLVEPRAALAQAPQAPGVQAADDHAALWHQHAFDLAQRGVRVDAELQRVGQQHQVDAGGFERQRHRIGQQIGPARGSARLLHQQ